MLESLKVTRPLHLQEVRETHALTPQAFAQKIPTRPATASSGNWAISG